jgi:hypothetical protein
MHNAATIRRFRMGAMAMVAGLLMSATSMAQGHGGGGHAGGFAGGHAGGFAGGHAGAYGRGGYGYRGGYGGWRGGYGGWRGYGGWYGGWGWGGLGYGLFFGALPLYYSTYWWGGMPYYYANDNYYVWNGTAGQYETVNPPPEVASQAGAAAPPASTNLFAYPKNGQTADQQSKDTFECHKWAAGQSGFDPTAAGSVAAPTPGANAAAPGGREDYLRAQAACLEGRGYSVQ